MVTMAKKLHQYSINGQRWSLRELSATLAQAGHVTKTGKPFADAAISKMIEA
jgi:hypothetical protein